VSNYTFATRQRKIRAIGNQFYQQMLEFNKLVIQVKTKSPRLRRIWLCLGMCVVLVLAYNPALSTALATKPTKKAVTSRISLSQPLIVRWRYASNSTLNLTPAADAERIYLPLAGGTIVSLRASDGQFYWKSEIGGAFSAAPAADERAVYVASETSTTEGDNRPAGGSIRALGHEGGVTAWLRNLPTAVRGGLAISNGRIFAGANDGNVYAVDKTTGNIVWSFHYGSAFNCQPVISGGGVYIGAEDGALLSIAEGTGKLQWRYGTHGPIRGPVGIVNDVVYVGSGDGYVYAVTAADGHLRWRARTGAAVQAVATVSAGILVASLDNFVYLLSFSGGRRIWKRQLAGRISAQPLTAEDSALFTPLSSEAGVVLGLRDGKQVNSLPAGEGINAAASPIVVADAVFLTTEHGLLAFSHPSQTKTSNGP
jgi:eukaryotic-like serine/threonine-protein kinase